MISSPSRPHPDNSAVHRRLLWSCDLARGMQSKEGKAVRIEEVACRRAPCANYALLGMHCMHHSSTYPPTNVLRDAPIPGTSTNPFSRLRWLPHLLSILTSSLLTPNISLAFTMTLTAPPPPLLPPPTQGPLCNLRHRVPDLDRCHRDMHIIITTSIVR